MSVEKPSIQQQKLAQANLSACQASVAEEAKQMTANAVKMLQQTIDQTSQMAAQIPEMAIGELNKVIELLMGLINGYINPSQPGFNIQAIIAQIEALLKPVISALSALPIPEIPGLSQIVKLLNALKTLVMNTIAQTAALAAEGIDVVGNGIKSDTGNLGADTALNAVSTGIKGVSGLLYQDVPQSNELSVLPEATTANSTAQQLSSSASNAVSSTSSAMSNAWDAATDTMSDIGSSLKDAGMTTWGYISGTELPPEIKTLLQKLLCSIMQLCITLPLVLENLIFQMLNTIIGLFKQIASIIGVPGIPFPLSLVPNCIAMMPDLTNFVINVPGKLMDITTSAIQDAWSIMTAQQMPKPPDPIVQPSKLPPCPQKAKSASASAGSSWLQGWGDAWNSSLSSSGLSSAASNAVSSTTNAFSNLGSASKNALYSSGELLENSTVGLLKQSGSAVNSWFN